MTPPTARCCGSSRPAPASTLRPPPIWSAASNMSSSVRAATPRSTPSAATPSSPLRSSRPRASPAASLRSLSEGGGLFLLTSARRRANERVDCARRVSSMLRSVAVVAVLIAGATAASADSIEDKAQICAACHGEKGLPADPSIPIIWGQNEGYLYLQLRDFQKGARKD